VAEEEEEDMVVVVVEVGTDTEEAVISVVVAGTDTEGVVVVVVSAVVAATVATTGTVRMISTRLCWVVRRPRTTTGGFRRAKQFIPTMGWSRVPFIRQTDKFIQECIGVVGCYLA
jgi:hypothetical protein